MLHCPTVLPVCAVCCCCRLPGRQPTVPLFMRHLNVMMCNNSNWSTSLPGSDEASQTNAPHEAGAAADVAPIGWRLVPCEVAAQTKRPCLASGSRSKAHNGGPGCSGGGGALRAALQGSGGAASGSAATHGAVKLLPRCQQPARWPAAEVGLGSGLVRQRGGALGRLLALVGHLDRNAPSGTPAGWRRGGRRRRCRRRPRWKSLLRRTR